MGSHVPKLLGVRLSGGTSRLELYPSTSSIPRKTIRTPMGAKGRLATFGHAPNPTGGPVGRRQGPHSNKAQKEGNKAQSQETPNPRHSLPILSSVPLPVNQ